MPDAVTECTVTDMADTEAVVESAIMQEDSAKPEKTVLRQKECAEITVNITQATDLLLKRQPNAGQPIIQNAEKIPKKVLEKIILIFSNYSGHHLWLGLLNNYDF